MMVWGVVDGGGLGRGGRVCGWVGSEGGFGPERVLAEDDWEVAGGLWWEMGVVRVSGL